MQLPSERHRSGRRRRKAGSKLLEGRHHVVTIQRQDIAKRHDIVILDAGVTICVTRIAVPADLARNLTGGRIVLRDIVDMIGVWAWARADYGAVVYATGESSRWRINLREIITGVLDDEMAAASGHDRRSKRKRSGTDPACIIAILIQPYRRDKR